MKVILSCEHAGNEIPKDYKPLFEGKSEILHSHRAYDPGAFDLFEYLKLSADFLIFQNVSRLLVEMNRSLNNSQLFSEFTAGLTSKEKDHILAEYYFPYRISAEKKIKQYIQKGEKVLHFSVHTFTPELDGKQRNADVGLLFDPERVEEKIFCKEFKKQLLEKKPELVVKFNYPYLGIDDGFTTYLRKIFPENYYGIELEVNQKFVENNKMPFQLKNAIKRAFLISLKK